MLLKKILTCGCVGMVLAWAALSSTNSMAGTYGTAGCGVGALIFKDKPGMIQILAGTTNGYFGNTFSITSGTSECEGSAHDTAAVYMTINHVALQKDISRGNGEIISGLSKIYRCDDSDALGRQLQNNYDRIYQNEADLIDKVPTRIETFIQNDADLKRSCKIFS